MPQVLFSMNIQDETEQNNLPIRKIKFCWDRFIRQLCSFSASTLELQGKISEVNTESPLVIRLFQRPTRS